MQSLWFVSRRTLRLPCVDVLTFRKALNAPVTRAVLGIALQFAVWLLVVDSIVGAYDRFDRAVEAQGETEQLAGELYGSIYGTLVFSGSLALIGLALTMEAAIRGRYRERWFFWASLVLAAPLCILFPIGTLFGAGYIVYLLVKRKEFFAPKDCAQ